MVEWTGSEWKNNVITNAFHNYDMGSLYVKENGDLQIIALRTGKSKWACGGEIAIWESKDNGKTWSKSQQLTKSSDKHHNYVRPC